MLLEDCFPSTSQDYSVYEVAQLREIRRESWPMFSLFEDKKNDKGMCFFQGN